MPNHVAEKYRVESVLKERSNRQVWMTIKGSPLHRCDAVHFYNKTQFTLRLPLPRCYVDLQEEKKEISFRWKQPQTWRSSNHVLEYLLLNFREVSVWRLFHQESWKYLFFREINPFPVKGGRCHNMAWSKAALWITATESGIMHGNLKTK